MEKMQEEKRNIVSTVGKWAPVVLMAWVIPGAGHFAQGRRVRGGLLAGAVMISFAVGLLMHGYLFEPQSGDLFTTLIYTGGHIANLAAGLPYMLAKWFGYMEPDRAGHVYDYGTKFLVAAGLMNILAVVDAFEIAIGKKN
jgi:hypothetical protein